MIIIISLFLAISLLFNIFSTPSKCSCTRPVSESPELGTLFSVMNGDRVRKLRGVVLYPNGEVMRDAVVEVYEYPLKVSAENVTYEDVRRITSVDRKAACLTVKDGTFCFEHLRPGKYLLRIGHRNDSQFSAIHLIVILDPSGHHSSKSELRVKLPLSI